MGKARDYYLNNRVARIEWRMSVPNECMLCGWSDYSAGFKWMETHEIERRSHAAGRWADPCNYLLLCNTCHSEVIPTMSHAEQLAVKWRKDQTHFNLEDWLRLRDPEMRAPTRVTLEDIGEFL